MKCSCGSGNWPIERPIVANWRREFWLIGVDPITPAGVVREGVQFILRSSRVDSIVERDKVGEACCHDSRIALLRYRLMLLAPDIVEAILYGRTPDCVEYTLRHT